MFEVNFWGPLRVVQAMTPLLPAVQGTDHQYHVVIGVHDPPDVLRVPDLQGGAEDLDQHLRMELAPFGIGVTNLEPGSVETPMVETGA